MAQGLILPAAHRALAAQPDAAATFDCDITLLYGLGGGVIRSAGGTEYDVVDIPGCDWPVLAQ